MFYFDGNNKETICWFFTKRIKIFSSYELRDLFITQRKKWNSEICGHEKIAWGRKLTAEVLNIMVQNNLIKMKNVIFSLAFMLIGSFAFANTTSKIDLSSIESQKFESISIENVQLNLDVVGTCYITINGYDKNDNLVFSQVLQINNVESAEQCDQIADQIAASLIK